MDTWMFPAFMSNPKIIHEIGIVKLSSSSKIKQKEKECLFRRVYPTD
jgi:hypothetical protein